MRRGRTLGLMMMVMGLAMLMVSCCGSRVGYVKGEPTPTPQEWEEARRQAEMALQEVLRRLYKDEAQLRVWGFRDKSELERARLGEPMLVCHLNKRDARAYSRQGRLAPLLACLPQWYFPILVDGEGRRLMIVYHTREDDDWGIGVGAEGEEVLQAMHELRVILESDPRFKGKSYDIKMVTFGWGLYPPTCFVEVDGEEYFVPLGEGYRILKERLKFYPVREVIRWRGE